MNERKTTYYRLAQAATLLVAVATFVTLNTNVRAQDDEDLTWDPNRPCTTLCGQGTPVGCGTTQHKNWAQQTGEVPNAAGEVHDYCKAGEGYCSSAHGCKPAQEGGLVSQLEDAVQRGDSAALARLVREGRGSASINWRREAIQVSGCGRILAHLPMSADLARRMSTKPDTQSVFQQIIGLLIQDAAVLLV